MYVYIATANIRCINFHDKIAKRKVNILITMPKITNQYINFHTLACDFYLHPINACSVHNYLHYLVQTGQLRTCLLSIILYVSPFDVSTLHSTLSGCSKFRTKCKLNTFLPASKGC